LEELLLLKKITIFGFKSFAEKTVLDFEHGVAGLIGPNGCGKSNIIDAIRWVTGETNISLLRGKKYEDVIFNGTASRKQLGYCEISVIINNENQKFIKDEHDEISVKRRLYRDGESQYFLNNVRCNLKDIHELFLNTGMGKSAYSVIGQGKIEAILSSKPEKRREIFEEAAGIAKFKIKIKETERKLEHTEENLLRINDIIFEVERDLESLREQAERAKEFKELKTKARDADIQINLYKVNAFNIQKQEVDKELKALLSKLNKIRDEIDAVYKEHAEKIKEIEDKEKMLKELQNQSNSQEISIRTGETKIAMLKDQQTSYRNALIQNKTKLEGLIERRDEYDNYINQRNRESVIIDEKIEGYENNLEEINEELNLIEETITNYSTELVNLKKQIEIDRGKISEKRKEQREVIDELILLIDEKKKELMQGFELKEELKTEIETLLSRIVSGLKEKHQVLHELLDEAMYKNINKQAELKEKLFRLLFELETLLGYSDKIKAHFQKFSSMHDGFTGIIFDKKGIHARKKGLDDEISLMENNIKENTTKITFIEDDIERKRENRDKVRKIMSEIQISLSSLNEKKKSYVEEIKRIIKQKTDFENSLSETNATIMQYEEKLITIDSEIQRTIDDYENNKIRLNELNFQVHKITDEISELTKNVQKFEGDINKLVSEGREVETKLKEVGLKVQEFELRRRNIIDNFYENYSVNLEELEFDEKNFNLQELEKIKSKAKAKLTTIGDNINLLAIDEYAERKERHAFLLKQKKDLEDSKKDLCKIISDINELSRNMFNETFEKVKLNFNKIFKRLFNGGFAEIKILDPEHVLDSGIEIEVQPPNKKLQSIMLLSGGEKTLTAIALIFAIFQAKPSPLCLLDEVDAPLDDANIGRFIKLISEFKDNTQFLVITHNSNTVQICDFLYGVTMEEPGITKVYSMKPENIEKAV